MTAKLGPKPVRTWCSLPSSQSHRSSRIGWLTSILVNLLSIAPAVAESSWFSGQSAGGVGPRIEMEDVGSFMGSLYFRECIRNEMAAACKALTDGSRTDVRATTWAKARALEKLGQLNEIRGDTCAAISDYIRSVKLNPTEPLQVKVKSLVDRLGGSCQIQSEHQDYLNTLALRTQRGPNAASIRDPRIFPDWATSIRWTSLPKLERLRLLKDLSQYRTVAIATTLIREQVVDVDPTSALVMVQASELDSDEIVATMGPDGGIGSTEPKSPNKEQISASQYCDPSIVAISLDCSPLSTGSLPNFVPVNFFGLTKNGPAIGVSPFHLLPMAALVLLSGFVFLIARTSWQSARIRANNWDSRLDHRNTMDGLSGGLDKIQASEVTRPPPSVDDTIIVEGLGRARLEELNGTAEAMPPSSKVSVLAAEIQDDINASNSIRAFSDDLEIELDRALSLLEKELGETPRNAPPISTDVSRSELVCDRELSRGETAERHLIALNQKPEGLLVLDGDGRVTGELRAGEFRASKTTSSLDNRAKPYFIVTPHTPQSAGILNPFVDGGMESDPLVKQQWFSAQFDLHAWIFEAMFGVAFVSQNKNTLRHFSKMLVGLPASSFRTWQELLSEDGLPNLPSYAHIAGAPETATFFTSVLHSQEFQFVAKQLQNSLSNYLSDPAFRHLTTATTSGHNLQSLTNKGYLIVLSATEAHMKAPTSWALSRMFLASAAGLRSSLASESCKLNRSTLIIRDAHRATGETMTEIQGTLSRMISLQRGLILQPNIG